MILHFIFKKFNLINVITNFLHLEHGFTACSSPYTAYLRYYYLSDGSICFDSRLISRPVNTIYNGHNNFPPPLVQSTIKPEVYCETETCNLNMITMTQALYVWHNPCSQLHASSHIQWLCNTSSAMHKVDIINQTNSGGVLTRQT